MSSGVVLSPNHAINKTRNAILRLRKCSPEWRTVLRQRYQDRIHNDRLRTLHSFRGIKSQDSFRVAFENILKDECNSSTHEELIKGNNILSNMPTEEFNIDEKLLLEELFEKELHLEHEDWLLQLYEELVKEDLEESKEVVCPLCCSGYLRQVACLNLKRTSCTNCPGNFVVEKSLPDLQAAVFDCLAWHDKQCCYNSGFVSIPKSERENSLGIICCHCSYLNIID